MAKRGTSTAMPKLRFPEFRGQRSWEIKELSQLLTTISNGLSLPQNSSGSGLKVTRIETIADGTIDLDRVGYVETTKKDIEDYRLNIGDVLFSNINSVAHIGKSVLVDTDQDLYHGMNLLRLRVDAESNSPHFVYFSINTPPVRESFRERANKAVNQASINQTEVSRTLIPAPSRIEQQKIADCLTSLDEVIAAQGRKVEALKAHKRGLMQQLFPREGETVPRLRFPEFRDGPEWEERTLGEISKLVRGPFGGSLKKEIFVENGYAVYEQSHAIYGDFSSFRYYISEDKFDDLKRFAVAATDIIMSCSGTMGKFAVIPHDAAAGVINQALLKLTATPSCNPQFLKEVLELPSVQQKLLSQSGGGAIQNVVSVDQIKALPLRLPGESEQRKIVDCVASFDAQIAGESEKLAALKTHKQGLMQQLFPSPVEASA